MKLLFFIFVSVFVAALTEKCIYKTCNLGDKKKLNVHIIAHTHDDVGWLKTVDQYYYGAKNGIQNAGVQYIIHTVVESLLENPDRKFTYVEIEFFHKWWSLQNQQMKDKVRLLVNEGRLQFSNGGWVMNDEAATHYSAIIDQMTLGLNFLNETFGECGHPSVGWQIDPFGHSIEQSNLFYQFGFDGWFFSRLDYRELNSRRKTKQMEFLQKTNFMQYLNTNYLFTSILYNTYGPPDSLCFDQLCDADPIVNDPQSFENNIDRFVDYFQKVIELYSKSYTTNNVLIPMGNDFNFQNAYHNFQNIDKLIQATNSKNKSLNVYYSTPSCYLYAVNNAQPQLKTHTNDFFPYASEKRAVWTGYYTSRPTVKYFIRQSNGIFQSCKKLYSLTSNTDMKLSQNVRQMSIEMAIVQHHDAVTGTEKQLVTFDYMRRLNKALIGCEHVINTTLHERKAVKQRNFNYDFHLCNLMNISVCAYSEEIKNNGKLLILFYNPLGYSIKKSVSIPINFDSSKGEYYHVLDSNDNLIISQITPIPQAILSIPERKDSSANFNLNFQIEIDAFGASSYVIVKNQTKLPYSSMYEQFYEPNPRLLVNRLKQMMVHPPPDIYKIYKDQMIVVENSRFQLSYDKGILSSVFLKYSKIKIDVIQQPKFYFSTGNLGTKNSGAYIFSTGNVDPNIIATQADIFVVNGLLVKEIHQQFNKWANLVTRIYENSDLIETEWIVGPLPNDKLGREVIIHYRFNNLNFQDKFYTDSNARQMIEREINFDAPINENYYPIDSTAIAVDELRNISFMIHTDRSQGGGTFNNDCFEFMVHRRCFYDDGFGVGEALNETGSDHKGLIAAGKHYFTFGSPQEIETRYRKDALEIFNRPLALFSKSSLSVVNNKSMVFQPIKFTEINEMALPVGLHILSLENHITDDLNVPYKILRLENISKQQLSVDISKVFVKYSEILSLEELNLSADLLINKVVRLNWNRLINFNEKKPLYGNVITVQADSIRTFKIIVAF